MRCDGASPTSARQRMSRSLGRRASIRTDRAREIEDLPSVAALVQHEGIDAAMVDLRLAAARERVIRPQRGERPIDLHIGILDLLVPTRTRSLPDATNEVVHRDRL